jgi:hypothetical protein
MKFAERHKGKGGRPPKSKPVEEVPRVKKQLPAKFVPTFTDSEEDEKIVKEEI